MTDYNISEEETNGTIENHIKALESEIERIDHALEMMEERNERALGHMDTRVRWLRDNSELKS